MFESTQLTMVLASLTSLGITLLIVFTKPWHNNFSSDDQPSIQKVHEIPTPRIGGLAIFGGSIVAWLSLSKPAAAVLEPLIVGGFIIFFVGLVEDISKRVSVRMRMLAAIAASVLTWWLTGISLNRVDLWVFDYLLAFTPIAVIFTVFAVTGFVNSINIIDGNHGLAPGVSILSLLLLGIAASLAGDMALAQVCWAIAAVTVGFLLVNFPLGKVFLGDGGAYLLGFLLAWLAIELPMRNAQISPWTSLIICAYPVLETLFTMARRIQRELSATQPDRLHLHSLIKWRIVHKFAGNWNSNFKNAAVAPFIWLFASIPGLVVINLSLSVLYQILLFLCSALCYALIYTRLKNFNWQFPKIRRRKIAQTS